MWVNAETDKSKTHGPRECTFAINLTHSPSRRPRKGYPIKGLFSLCGRLMDKLRMGRRLRQTLLGLHYVDYKTQKRTPKTKRRMVTAKVIARKLRVE